VRYVWDMCGVRYVWDMCGVRYANNLLKNPATKRLSGKTPFFFAVDSPAIWDACHLSDKWGENLQPEKIFTSSVFTTWICLRLNT